MDEVETVTLHVEGDERVVDYAYGLFVEFAERTRQELEEAGIDGGILDLRLTVMPSGISDPY